MAVPALLYLLLNAGRAGGRGWAVPMATDIAFAVAVLALLGPRVPASLRLFVLTLAVADDIGAIVVIAFFYNAGFHLVFLAGAATIVAVVMGLRRAGVAWAPLHVACGAALWAAVHASGVHATMAGVVLGLLTPALALNRLEDRLRPWVGYGILPVFALANAGVGLRADVAHAPGALRVVAGVTLGLVVGKVLGITGAARIAVGVGLGRPPEGSTWSMVAAAATVGGIGFTVSLFVAELAFAAGPLQDAAKVGVLGGSVVAGTAGALVLRLSRPPVVRD
jgi:NhaA family Na+:H+ antiporter